MGGVEVVDVGVEEEVLEELGVVLVEEVDVGFGGISYVSEPVSLDDKESLSVACVQAKRRTLNPTTNRPKDTSL